MDGVTAIEVPAEVQSRIFRVAVENILPIWPQWEPLVTRGLRDTETHTALDVRRMVLGEQAQLWVQWSGSLDAFVVTEFAHYPQGTWVRLFVAASAPDVEFDGEAFEAALTEWKDAHKCRGFELIGRTGWLRRFRGAKFVSVIMRTTA